MPQKINSRMGGGNAHDRAVSQAKIEREASNSEPSVSAVNSAPESPVSNKESRLLRALEEGFERVSKLFSGTENKKCLQTSLRLLGGGGFIFGAAAMIFPVLFWWGTCLLILSAIVWSVDVWAEALPVALKTALQAFIALLIGVFIWKVAMFPADPQVTAFWAKSDYPIGSNIDGIAWHKGLSELRVNIANPTGRDFSDFDFSIMIDEGVQDVVQTSSVPCTRLNDKPWVVHDSLSNVWNRGPIYGPVRFRCDKIPARSTVSFFLALANVKEMAPPKSKMNIPNGVVLDYGKLEGNQSEMPYSLLGPKKKPQQVIFVATYSVLFRPHSGRINLKIGDL